MGDSNGAGDFEVWVGRQRVAMVSDDRSQIGDLGAVSWSGLLEQGRPPEFRDRAEAHVGHIYLVHTLDGDTEALSLFRVNDLVPGDRVEIEWLLVDAAVLPRER